MTTTKYHGAQEIRKTYEVSSETLRRWNNQGKISSIRTSGGKRLYSVTDVEKIFQEKLRTGNDEERLKTREIRMYPTPEEREKLKRWMGTVRWTYNKVLGMMQDDGISDMNIIRKHYLNDECFTNEELSWVKETPRENEIQNKKRSFANYLDTSKRLESKERCIRIPEDCDGVRKTTRNKSHRERNHEQIGSFLRVRVRTFMTGYDPDGRIVEWGNGDLNKIFRLSKKYDKLQKDKDLAIGRKNKRKRYKLKIKMYRIIVRIRNLINECHHQLARWLCENYKIILIPKFETSNMVLKNKRKIREFTSCKVIECTEEYTSKTCGNCGSINKKLGGSKIFRCESCSLEIDRDMNGARNILLKRITEVFSITFTYSSPYDKIENDALANITVKNDTFEEQDIKFFCRNGASLNCCPHLANRIAYENYSRCASIIIINNSGYNMTLDVVNLEDGRWVTSDDYGDDSIDINLQGYISYIIEDDRSSQFIISWEVSTLGPPMYYFGFLDGSYMQDYNVKFDYSLGETIYQVKIDKKTPFPMSWLIPISLFVFFITIPLCCQFMSNEQKVVGTVGQNSYNVSNANANDQPPPYHQIYP
ncbi:12453_t:CDS:2 [Dentiscutata erythropus]|uniref:12453_t:CDS:1 n=1 Tax=Dentiscutata erythropus TaxID=1348616 RepID=A0A9N9NWW2_9GLOM|nr:12453_t:CDS:2 [Dentiscutata erythropus]